MTSAHFEQLIADAGLNLLLSYLHRFVVSLRVGSRVQCCTLVLDPEKSDDEARAYVAAKRAELEQAAKTQQGRMAEERSPAPATQTEPVQKIVSVPSTVGYPAH